MDGDIGFNGIVLQVGEGHRGFEQTVGFCRGHRWVRARTVVEGSIAQRIGRRWRRVHGGEGADHRFAAAGHHQGGIVELSGPRGHVQRGLALHQHPLVLGDRGEARCKEG